MNSISQSSQTSRRMIWAGRILSGIVVVFMLMDGTLHLTTVAPVVQAFAQLGFPLRLSIVLALIELVCVALYVYPRTSVLGSILLTGYLGGAVAMQLRVGNPLFGETLFPVYVGILAWGGLYGRNPQLRALIPLKQAAGHREPAPENQTAQYGAIAGGFAADTGSAGLQD